MSTAQELIKPPTPTEPTPTRPTLFWRRMFLWFFITRRLNGWDAVKLLDHEYQGGRYRAARGEDTNARALIRKLGANTATLMLRRVERTLNRAAGTCDKLTERAAGLRRAAGEVMEAWVTGPRGGLLTVTETKTHSEHLAQRLDAEEAAGNLRHRLVPARTKRIIRMLVVALDFPIMLWFASSVFNVDWDHPIGMPLLISLVVSLLTTGGATIALHHLGHEQREHKTPQRQLGWAELPTESKIGLIAVAILVGLIATVMFVRVYTEGVLSGLFGLAILLAILVAFVMLISASLVFWTAFRDGSTEQDDLAHYTALIRAHLTRKAKLEKHAAQIDRQIELARRKAERTRSRGIVKASGPMRSADEWIELWKALHPENDHLALPVTDPNTATNATGHDAPRSFADARSVTTTFEHIQSKPRFTHQAPHGREQLAHNGGPKKRPTRPATD
jgi:uncharacterized membrane protein